MGNKMINNRQYLLLVEGSANNTMGINNLIQYKALSLTTNISLNMEKAFLKLNHCLNSTNNTHLISNNLVVIKISNFKQE